MLDLASPDLWVSIAFVSASNFAILSALARSRPAYLRGRRKSVAIFPPAAVAQIRRVQYGVCSQRTSRWGICTPAAVDEAWRLAGRERCGRGAPSPVSRSHRRWLHEGSRGRSPGTASRSPPRICAQPIILRRSFYQTCGRLKKQAVFQLFVLNGEEGKGIRVAHKI